MSVGDPYQSEPANQSDAASRHNAAVMARSTCVECDDPVPESDQWSWKYAAAGGLLEGPFCSPECYCGWVL